MDYVTETPSSTLSVSSAPRWVWLGALVPVLLLGAIYAQSIAYLVLQWYRDENYGHGFFIPVISLCLLWAARDRLRTVERVGSWWGFAVVAVGLALYFVGEFATLYVVLHLSLWVVTIGLVLAAIGWRAMGTIAFPLLYLLVMIPLPDFLHQQLSGRLQLLSSQWGVGFLELVGVTALREGNVIDLGTTQLQVVEACSGLRYLFPLSALALICAYLFDDRMWKRIALFLVSIPIAVGLNIFRIGMTGLLVDTYGVEIAEGFFHAFSGWLLFVTGLVLLAGAAVALGRIGARGRRRSLLDLFGSRPRSVKTETIASTPKAWWSSPAYLLSVTALIPVLVASTQLASREEVPPPRLAFTDFPMDVGEWRGRSVAMDQVYLNALRFDDYVLADYRLSDAPAINFYVAYYRSQKKGQSAHSPRTCMPGGGWEIASLRRMEVPGTAPADVALEVNRTVIKKGDAQQVVWYWFQERGRIVTSEYLVKFYLLWDAMTRNRTDGALVRLTTAVQPGESEAQVDGRLASFVKRMRPLLAQHIPN